MRREILYPVTDLTPARRDATVVPVGGREVTGTFEAVLREQSIDREVTP